MNDTSIQNEVWRTVLTLNRTWAAERRPEKLAEYFHRDMVAIPGNARERIEGREACVAAWKAFVDASTIHSFKELDPRVQVYGNAAVVTYYYEITFEWEGKKIDAAGRDMFFLIREGGKWWAVANHFSGYPGETG